MSTNDRGTDRRTLGPLGSQEARAATVLAALWIGTAVILKGDTEFASMIALLAAASMVLWGTGTGRHYVVGQFILWGPLLAGSAWVLWESPRLAPVLALFGLAALWFVIGEPTLGRRRT